LQQHVNKNDSGSDHEFENQRQQLESKQQQERQNLETYFREQSQALHDHEGAVRVQMRQDRENLGAALNQVSTGVDRQVALKDVLTRQDTTRRDLSRAIEEQLFSKFAQKAFASNFSETQAIKAVWEKAASGEQDNKKGFAKAREKFWNSVNNSTDKDSETIRKVLQAAGYELQKGSNAPLLSMSGWDHSRPTREITERRLTIDHADPQSSEAKKTLRSDNLRFMSQMDNSIRGNRYDKYEKPRKEVDT